MSWIDREDVWPESKDIESTREGWALFDCDGVLMIQKLDDVLEAADRVGHRVAEFPDDEAAIQHVYRRAMCGSILHLTAVLLHGTNDQTLQDIVVPELLPAGGNHG